MNYKRIITSGCSFSDPTTPYTWVNQLENYVKRESPHVSFDHRGLSSQGQDLITKKAMFAINKALSEGIKPEEICVFVMWSSNDRRAFFVNEEDYIKKIVNNWKLSNQGWQLQFGDFNNRIENPSYIESVASMNNRIEYNPRGGWLITSAYCLDDPGFIRDHYLMGGKPSSIHSSLEYIIMLQSFCKSKGIKLYQQYFMDITYDDFEEHKGFQIMEYLYNILDYNTFIFPNKGKSIHGFLKDNIEYFKSPTDAHPNGLGHRIWLTDVMLPHLQEDDFFN